MTLATIVERCGFQVLSGQERLSREVRRGYASDLLSDVLAHAREGDLWVTLQTHVNIVAVAAMRDLAAIVLTGGRQPEPETLAKARAEAVPLLATPLPSFDAIARLCALGLRGTGPDGEGA